MDIRALLVKVKETSKSGGTDDAGYGNATNAEEHNSQNQSGILFPVAEEISRTETDLIAMIKTTGKHSGDMSRTF